VLDACTQARTPIEGVEANGDPIEVLPRVFHALWRERSTAAPDQPSHERLPVGPGGFSDAAEAMFATVPTRRSSVAGTHLCRSGWRRGTNRVERSGRPVVAVDARVCFRDGWWQVVGSAGARIHPAREDEEDEVVLAGSLSADPAFAVSGGRAAADGAAMGAVETAPATARERASACERHIREVESGRAGGPEGGGVVRPEYDPARWTLAERERAKAGELSRALGGCRARPCSARAAGIGGRAGGAWSTTARPVALVAWADRRARGGRDPGCAPRTAGAFQGDRQGFDAVGRAAHRGPAR